jgi:AraC-like DNA-binding protein/mannose-6-phosphate isomerase-like protein (cupin superfamily)
LAQLADRALFVAVMPVSRPVAVTLPAHGVAFAESIHGPSFRMAERVDPFHKLIYVLQGRIAFTVVDGGEPLRAGAGATVCVQAGVRHQIADTEPSTLLLLCFAREFLARDAELDRIWSQLTGGKPAALRAGGLTGPRFEGLWQAGIAEQAGRQPGREVALRAAAENILVTLTRLPARTPADAATERVAAVARELVETFYEPWSLERACACAGMSRRHFSKLFREQTGRTFLEQLTELRLAHAADLLRQGRHSIIGAAFSSGYGDLSHFYRLFRARFGQPPRAWLEKRPGNTRD